VEEIGDYIFSDNPKAAVKFVSDLRLRCDTLKVLPKEECFVPNWAKPFVQCFLGVM
jgi:hypothetical protein